MSQEFCIINIYYGSNLVYSIITIGASLCCINSVIGNVCIINDFVLIDVISLVVSRCTLFVHFCFTLYRFLLGLLPFVLLLGLAY